MKNLLHLLMPSIIFLAFNFSSRAQPVPFVVYDSVDVGNINARVSVHGNLWYDVENGMPKCEFPKGSGKHVGFAGALWMGGYDDQGQLRVSAQTYSNTNADFWPGPIDSLWYPVSYAKANNWARIWKVTRAELNQHLANTAHTVSNTPASILEWPGNGNIYAKGKGGVALTFDLGYPRYAPFVDKNGNNIYEPLQGEYPRIKGDQALWWIYNDYGPAHNVSNTLSLQADIACLAYAYDRNTLADNIIFYEYSIFHSNALPIDSFVLGLFTDFDLGYGFDDYIGFDSARNLVFSYNGGNSDLNYGDTIPAVGVTILKWDYEDTCGTTFPAGSFMYFNGGNDATRGEPSNGVEFYNYMTSSWRNGQRLKNDYQGQGIPSSGTGNGPNTNYVFNGDPANGAEWSECASLNAPYDRKGIIASVPKTILPGKLQHFAFALLAAPPKYQNDCPNFTLQDLRDLADTAQVLFCQPPVYTGLKDLRTGKLYVHPNPAAEYIIAEGKFKQLQQIRLIDALGRSCKVSFTSQGNSIRISTAELAPGVYYLLCSDGETIERASFIKQ